MRIIVAISGASGTIYGIRILEELHKKGIETHLIVSRWGRATLEAETSYGITEVMALASHSYDEEEQGAVISSGTFKTDGMIIAPCSMKTLSGIANGYSDNLLTRAADVCIKEGRRLVLLTRETPLSAIHLENMLKLARLGVTIMPPVPAFYAKPGSLDDMVRHTVGRVLAQFGIDIEGFKCWEGFERQFEEYRK